MSSRPVSPRPEDQVMFGNGVRIMWKAPVDTSTSDLNLQVKECNIVVAFNVVAFSMVRRAILDYYREHPDFSIVYVTDSSNTNERVDKFKITKTTGNGNKEQTEFTIKFTNSKTSAVVSGRLSDVYNFILNDYTDIERIIHCRHTENSLLEKKTRDMRLEPPSNEWSPLMTPNLSSHDSLTSSTMSMISDQDTSESLSAEFMPMDDSRSGSFSNPRISKSRSRQSFLSMEDCQFDSDNSLPTDTPPKTDKRNSSQTSTLKRQSGSTTGRKHPPANVELVNNIKLKAGVAVPSYKQATEITAGDKPNIDSIFGTKFSKINVKRPRRTASHFMFAVHLVNIQRQMGSVQQAIAAMENKLKAMMGEMSAIPQKQQQKQRQLDNDWLLDKIQAIIREELRMVKDDVTSSKTQVKCNRELIKRVYVEMNNRISKEVADIQARLAKLESRSVHRKASRTRTSGSDET